MKGKIYGIYFVFGVMLLLSITAHAQAPAAAEAPAAAPSHPDWYACESDGDCVRDASSCGGMIAVNQSLLQEYHEANAKNMAGAECPDLPRGTRIVLDAMQAKCEAKHCITTLPGAPSNKDIDIQWFQCSTDADCFYDAGACGGPTSLNERYREPYHQAMLKRTAPGECAPMPLPKDLTPGLSSKQAVAACRNQMCETVISASAPDTGNPDGRWMACDTDSDCVKIEAVCGALMPINKKYQERMEKMMSPARSKMTFACYFLPDNAKTMTQQLNARCKFNLCTLDK